MPSRASLSSGRSGRFMQARHTRLECHARNALAAAAILSRLICVQATLPVLPVPSTSPPDHVPGPSKLFVRFCTLRIEQSLTLPAFNQITGSHTAQTAHAAPLQCIKVKPLLVLRM